VLDTPAAAGEIEKPVEVNGRGPSISRASNVTAAACANVRGAINLDEHGDAFVGTSVLLLALGQSFEKSLHVSGRTRAARRCRRSEEAGL